MGRPAKVVSGPATSDRILEAAEREFARHGFEATRLEDIATRVGLTRPSVLHRFGSKEALYAAVVERVCARLRESLLQAMGVTGDFPARLRATVGRFVDHLAADSTAAHLLLRELVDARGPGERLLREQVGPLLGLVEAFVRQSGKGVLRRRLDVRAAILDLVGAVTLHAVAGASRPALYGSPANPRAYSRDHFLQLASRTFLEEAPAVRGRRTA